MATKKKLLQAAAGTAAAGGAAGLNVEQVFSTYLYEGNGSSQTINNGIELGQSNAVFLDTGANRAESNENITLGTNDFTIEFWWKGDTQTDRYPTIIGTLDEFNASGAWRVTTYLDNANSFEFDDATTSYQFSTTNYNDGVWRHFAVVRQNGTLKGYVDGTQVGSSFTVTTSFTARNLVIGGNYRDNHFINGTISDIRIVNGTAVYTSNFTAPTSELQNITNTELLYARSGPLTADETGNFTFTNYGATAVSTFPEYSYSAYQGEGGLVWGKNRDAAFDHNLTDTERGVSRHIRTNTTDAEQYLSGYNVTSFNSNGFSLGLGNDLNGSYNYATWTFRKAPKFFDCIKFTGDGNTEQAVAHNLGVAPACYAIKRLDSTSDWYFYTTVIDGSHDYLFLNTTAAKADSSRTAPTSTHVYPGNILNASGAEYVIYMWANNDGDGDFGPTGDQDIIKCGSYTGTGSSGNFVDLGFEPQWVLIKNASQSYSYTAWNIFDNMRGVTTSGTDALLMANSSASEGSDPNNPSPYSYIDFNSTGFTPAASVNQTNGSGDTYIYIAIRRGPMAVPTDATDVFAIQDGRAATDGTASANAYTSGFPVDLLIQNNKNGGSHPVIDRLRSGAVYLKTDATDAEVSWNMRFDDMDGVWREATASAASYFMAYMWKRAPSFCDVVAYTGNSTAGRAINHNLGVAPEMIWVKNRTTAGYQFIVWHKDLSGNNYNLYLNSTNAESAHNLFSTTAPDENSWYTGTQYASYHNDAADDYIAYLFASVDGVSKVGSYVGDNVNGRVIDCGFTNGARFVLIKKAIGGTGNWQVFDTERGIVTGNDPRLELDSTSAELTGFDFIDPSGSGFALTNRDDTNETGHTYIFYAIA